MNHDISQPVPQGSDGAQDAENSRIAAIADELERLCAVHEAQCGDSLQDVSRFETEQRVAEQMAKDQGFWIPMIDVFNLGVPGPCGNENDTYVGEKVIYKVNNLLNSGSIVGLLHKILMHNILFPDTGSPVKSCVSNKTKPRKPFCSGRDDVSDAVSAGLVL